MTQIEASKCKKLVKICKRNLVLYYISITGETKTGLTQIAGYGVGLIDNNFFRHFMFGWGEAKIQKHSVRMFQMTNFPCTCQLNEVFGVGIVSATDVVIPSGVLVVVSVDNINHDVLTSSHYNERWTFVATTTGTPAITASDNYLVEVVKA